MFDTMHSLTETEDRIVGMSPSLVQLPGAASWVGTRGTLIV
jgi:hypothetical protein